MANKLLCEKFLCSPKSWQSRSQAITLFWDILGSGLDGGDRQIIYGNKVCESNDCSGMSDKIFYQYHVLQKYPTDRFW